MSLILRKRGGAALAMATSALMAAVAMTTYEGVAWGYTGYSESFTNPSTVSAVIAKPCKVVLENLTKSLGPSTSELPFVQSVTSVSGGDWVQTSKDTTALSDSRTLYYSASTTWPKEFPLSIFPVDIQRYTCLPEAKECMSTATITIDGAKAFSYQKAVALQSGGPVLGSFTVTTMLMGETTGQSPTCRVYSYLSIKDNNYLWVKRKLIGGVAPTVVEKSIHRSFVGWAKKLLPVLEQ